MKDLSLSARAVRDWREPRLTPEGKTIVAPLPDGIRSHFSAEPHRFALMRYHHGQVTTERLLEALGVSIASR